MSSIDPARSAEARSQRSSESKIFLVLGPFGGTIRSMPSSDLWDHRAARAYDTPGQGMFAPDVLDPAVDRLADLVDGEAPLEFGVGTGRLAIPLVERGIRIVGIESSGGMIDRRLEKIDERRLPVAHGDMVDARVEGDFGLVFVAYNTLSNLLTQREQSPVSETRRVISLPESASWSNCSSLTAFAHSRSDGLGLLDRAGVPWHRHLGAGNPALGLSPRSLLARDRRRPNQSCVPDPAPLSLAVGTRSHGPIGRARVGCRTRRLERSSLRRQLTPT